MHDDFQTIPALKPFRYRGYRYDADTGFYYLQSRYYDPVIGRFVNADGLASTGQGFIGYNMFAYQYLHGTNADVGDFHISGIIRKTQSGEIEFALLCTWNDIIDPNPIYPTDVQKANFANTLPFANPTDYRISISWFYTNMFEKPYVGSCVRPPKDMVQLPY